MATVCATVAQCAEAVIPSVLKEIKETEKGDIYSPSQALPEMGGQDGPGNRLVISIDLGNSTHVDVNDTPRCFSFWVEHERNLARNWYFVMPNLCIDGSAGVKVQLFHGCMIVWDGCVIRHNTSKTLVGPGNHVYGIFFCGYKGRGT